MKLSIIVPIFNSEKYIDECVKSILHQTYKDLEIILVNDGSTDASDDRCAYYANLDTRIKYINKENGGPLSALRAGLEIATGEYVGFIDSDDWIEAEMYKTMMSKVVENCCDIVVVGYKTFNKNIETINNIFLKEGYYDRQKINDKIIPNLINGGSLNFRSCIYLSRINKIFRKKLLENNFEYYLHDNINYGEDNLMTVSAVLDSESMYVLSNYYPYHYRIENESSLTHKHHDKLWEKFCCLDSLMSKMLIEKGYEEQIEQVKNDYVFHAVVSLINVKSANASKKEKLFEIKEILSNPKSIEVIDRIAENEENFFKRIFLWCMKHKKYRLIYFILCIRY